MRNALTAGLLLGLVLAGCGGPRSAPGLSRRRRRKDQAPDFWRPVGQAKAVPFSREAIGKGSVVFPTSLDHKLAAAIYDPKADRWRLYGLRDAHSIAVDHPHVWVVEKNGDCVYYDTATGRRRNFKSVMSAELLRPPMHLPDAHTWPKVVAADGKWWSGCLKSYDPAKGKWEQRDTTGLPEKPPWVLDAVETDAFLWVVFAVHGAYYGGPHCRLYVFDKAARSWSLITKDTRQIHRARGGVWVQGAKVRFWDAAKRAFTRELPQAQALCPVGERLWAIGSQSLLMTDDGKGNWAVVKQVQSHTYGARAQALSYDGRYVWAGHFPFGLVTRYDSKTAENVSYPVVDGVVGPVSNITFGSRGIWFQGRELVRYDRAKGKWRTFTTRDGLPANRANYLVAAGEKEAYVLVDARGGRRASTKMVGLAHYAAATDKLTYYPLSEGKRPWWIHSEVHRKLCEVWPQSDTYATWVMLAAARGLRTSTPRMYSSCRDGGDVWLNFRGKLCRWNAKTGKVSFRKDIGMVAGMVADRDALWLALNNASVVRLDKATGKTEKFGPELPGTFFREGFATRAGEMWFSLRPPSGRGGLLFRVTLHTRRWKVFTGRDCAPIGSGVIPVACDDDYLWCRGGGGAGGRVAVYIKRKRRWKLLPYLPGSGSPWDSGGIWFDGDWAYCNINRKLHRAPKADLIKSVR